MTDTVVVKPWVPIESVKLRATDPHIGGWIMPLTFSDAPPPAPRTIGATADARLNELKSIAEELKNNAKIGIDPDMPTLMVSKWAILEKGVRSPERWFGLRKLECEVRVVNDGTAPSLRDSKQHVVTSTIYARYHKGYVWTPRGAKARAS